MAEFDVQLILADAAQAAGGKVSMLGAGWSVTGTPTGPQAVVGLIKVPWDRANEALPLKLELVDADGRPAALGEGPDGSQQRIEFTTTIEVGRPPGLTPGTPIDASFMVNVAPLPLPPGRYTWRLELADDVVSTSFQVVAQLA